MWCLPTIIQINQCVATALREGRTVDDGYADAGIDLGRRHIGIPKSVPVVEAPKLKSEVVIKDQRPRMPIRAAV